MTQRATSTVLCETFRTRGKQPPPGSAIDATIARGITLEDTFAALAPELTLRPVLVEIGASCPAPGLYLLDSEYETSPDLDAWLAVARKFVPAAAPMIAVPQ